MNVWGEKYALKRLCKTQDLILIVYPFTNLVCESLIICRFLFIYIQYLFIAFAYHIHLCYYLFLDMCIVPFTLSQK